MCLAEHAGGQISVHGECHRSRPGNRRQRPLLLPAALSLLLHRRRPGHRHRYQTAGLRDDLSLSADCQRHGQHTHQREVLIQPNAQAHTELCVCGFIIFFVRIKTNWDRCPGLLIWRSASPTYKTWTPFSPTCPTAPTSRRTFPWLVLQSHLTSHRLFPRCRSSSPLQIPLCRQKIPHLSFAAFFIPNSFRPMFNFPFDNSIGVWSRCMRNMIKTEAWVIIRAGCLTSHSLPWAPLCPQDPTHTQTQPQAPRRTALQVLESVITVGDLQSCFRDVRPLAKVTDAFRIYLTMLPLCTACVRGMKPAHCVQRQNNEASLWPYFCLYCRFVIYRVSVSLYAIMFSPLIQPIWFPDG